MYIIDWYLTVEYNKTSLQIDLEPLCLFYYQRLSKPGLNLGHGWLITSKKNYIFMFYSLLQSPRRSHRRRWLCWTSTKRKGSPHETARCDTWPRLSSHTTSRCLLMCPKYHRWGWCITTNDLASHFTDSLSALHQNLMILFILKFDFNHPIRSQFCTYHDSLAVMICAKLWPDVMIIFHVSTS